MQRCQPLQLLHVAVWIKAAQKQWLLIRRLLLLLLLLLLLFGSLLCALLNSHRCRGTNFMCLSILSIWQRQFFAADVYRSGCCLCRQSVENHAAGCVFKEDMRLTRGCALRGVCPSRYSARLMVLAACVPLHCDDDVELLGSRSRL